MRCVISFLLIFSAIAANARQISPDEAQTIATEFFNSGSSTKARKAPCRAISAVYDETSGPQPYYIFNATDDAGFVIISGDTRAKKIIGYSDKGTFNTDNMPPQLKGMLEQYAKAVETLPATQDSSWQNDAIATASEEANVLETAAWNQDYPYNLMTPAMNGVQTVTGCVATAVAIIMKYHNWPETGCGYTSYESNGHTVSFDFDNTSFDWDLMPLEFADGQYTYEQALEVSKAMYAAGNAVHATYGIDETYANKPAYGMYRYLKFDIPKRDVVIQDALEVCLNNLCRTVQSEILADRPMLLLISMDYATDHLVVVDGYDSQNYIHLNYGWGGSSNGFYNPEVVINFTKYIYSNIKPDRDEASSRDDILPDDGALSNSGDGGSLRSGLVILGEIKQNEDFGFVYHIAFPIEPMPDFRLGLLHMSSEGAIKDVLWSENLDLSIQNGDITGQSWTSITKDIEDDDRVTLAYKKEETDEWHIMKDTQNAKASVGIIAPERDYIHFSIVSDPDVNLEIGPYAIIEDQKDSWNYSGKIEKCNFNPNASVNESFILGQFSLHNNIGCATISINGIEIGQIEHNYLNDVPIVVTNISDVSNFVTYLPDSIIIEVKKYLYEDMLTFEKYVEEAGTLSQLFTLADAKYTRSLTLSGQIDINDLKFVEENCPFLQILDLSNADIIDGVLPSNAYFRSTKMLQQIKLPRNLTKIESEAFMGKNGYGGIRIVYIPEGVEEIGARAFGLGEITSVVMANPKPIDVQNLHDAPFRFASAIYVPKGSKSEYENAGWGQYWNGVFYDRNVIEYEGDFIPIDSIGFSQEITTMKIGEKISVDPVVYPNNSSEQWNGYLKVTGVECGIQLSDNNIEAIVESSNLITVNHSNLYAHMLVNVAPRVSSIVLNETDATLNEGQTVQLTATVLPEPADNKTLQWTSSNETVATVDQSGLVTAIAQGSAVVTAHSTDGSEVSATCYITVRKPVSDIVLNETDATLNEGQTVQLTATVSPELADNKTLQWTSSNEAVATVDQSGLVTAISRGSTVITVSSTDGSDVSATCYITVRKLVSEIALNETEAILNEGQTIQLTATVSPELANNKTLQWITSNESVATVDDSGFVTAISQGLAVITVSSTDGSDVSATCYITVRKFVSEIVLSETEAILNEGQTVQLTATALPEPADNKTLHWASSNEAVATVDDSGLVTAIAQGSAVITVSSTDGSDVSATCDITVRKLVSEIVLSETEATLNEGQTIQLTATVLPGIADNKGVRWTTSNGAVAIVDESGHVTGLSQGIAVITVTSIDGSNVSASCNVIVRKPVTEIILSSSSIALKEGESMEISATVIPDDATNADLIWTSSDETVATVQDGLIKALKQGTSVIRAEAADGSGVYAECVVEVSAESGIAEVSADGISITTEPYVATVHGITENATILLFDMNGKTRYIGNGPRIEVAQTGVYILVVNNAIFKIQL